MFPGRSSLISQSQLRNTYENLVAEHVHWQKQIEILQNAVTELENHWQNLISQLSKTEKELEQLELFEQKLQTRQVMTPADEKVLGEIINLQRQCLYKLAANQRELDKLARFEQKLKIALNMTSGEEKIIHEMLDSERQPYLQNREKLRNEKIYELIAPEEEKRLVEMIQVQKKPLLNAIQIYGDTISKEGNSYIQTLKVKQEQLQFCKSKLNQVTENLRNCVDAFVGNTSHSAAPVI